MVNDNSGVRAVAVVATAAVFVQLLLGAVMRHIGAGLAIPDFPTSFGRWVPPLDGVPVAVHFAHRVGAVLVAGTVGYLAWRAQGSSQRRLWWLGWALGALVVFQIALGGLAVLTGKAVTPTTLHVAIGAAILGGCFLLTLRARRLGQGEAPRLRAAAPAVAASGLKAWS